jgi:ParB family chromosome partitioning protein
VPRTLLKSTRTILEHPTEIDHKAGVRAESRRTLQPNALVSIPMSEIAETPENLNSRLTYDEDSLSELAASIREHGILQPLVVRPLQPHETTDYEIRINGQLFSPQYVLIAGNRRYRAGRMAGLTEFPCLIKVTTADRAFILNIVENCQRRDLTGRERARAISMLASLRGEDEAETPLKAIRQLTGLHESTISRWVKIDRTPELQAAVASETLPLGKAMKLTSAPREHLTQLIEEASTLTQPEIVARVTALRREQNVRAVRTATLNEGRAMDALRMLNRIDAVEEAGPVRDLLVLILHRVNELLIDPSQAHDLPKANGAPRRTNERRRGIVVANQRQDDVVKSA